MVIQHLVMAVLAVMVLRYLFQVHLLLTQVVAVVELLVIITLQELVV